MFIKIDCSFYSHHKVKKLARCLGVRQHQVVGILIYLWSWAMTYRQDGDLTDVDPIDLFDGLDFECDRRALFSLLEESGFIDDLRLHNWGLHYEKVKIARERTRERVQKHREKNHVTRYSVTEGVTCNAPCNDVTQETKTKTKKETKKETKNLNTVPEEVLQDASAGALAPAPRQKKKPRETTDGSQVWEAYRQAMVDNWQLDPPRSAQTSAQAKKLAEMVGKETAIKLAAYFPTRRSEWYVKKGHPFGLLLTDHMALLREVSAGLKLTGSVVNHIVRKEEAENYERASNTFESMRLLEMDDDEFSEYCRRQDQLAAQSQTLLEEKCN